MNILEHLHSLLSPEVALFLCLALGFRLGKVKFGKFQLGGVAGSLLVAVIVSQFGVGADSGLKNVLFALFIYAVGFESGPQFFRSLNRGSIREILLAFCLAATGLLTVVVLAKVFHLDKGLAAGVAAGGLTQSAIIGTASDAIARLGLAADQVKTLQQNVAVGYAVTYIFGSLGTIIICCNVLPKFMGRSIRDDAMAAEASQQAGKHALSPDQEPALRHVIGRAFRLPAGFAKTVHDVETADPANALTVEMVRRNKKPVAAAPDLTLREGDEVLIVGNRDAIAGATPGLGSELWGEEDDALQLNLQRVEVVLTSDAFSGKSVMSLGEMLKNESTHGVYVLSVSRQGGLLDTRNDALLEKGDILTLYGSPKDVAAAAGTLGHLLIHDIKTDFVYNGIGLVAGLLIGMITVRIGGLPLTLGSGGGALLSGLLFGWWRTRNPEIGNLPPGAIQILKDLGLAGFVVVVGLASGLEAVNTVKESGLSIFIVGCLVTIIPLLLTMVIGRYIIGYKNTAIFTGALAGSRSANPAFGEILNKAGNSIPTVPFAITYALANVFLTLLGPLVVSFA